MSQERFKFRYKFKFCVNTIKRPPSGETKRKIGTWPPFFKVVDIGYPEILFLSLKGWKMVWKNPCFQHYSNVRFNMAANFQDGYQRLHDDVIRWKHFPRYRPFVRGIHRSPVDSPHKGQLRAALMGFFICAWTNGWINKRRWWFGTPSHSLWRQCNASCIII